MLPSLKYFSVNWVDGMKITKDHFIGMENALLDNIRDSYALTLKDFNYGLLPAVSSDKLSLDLEILKRGGESLLIKLNSCLRDYSRGMSN